MQTPRFYAIFRTAIFRLDFIVQCTIRFLQSWEIAGVRIQLSGAAWRAGKGITMVKNFEDLQQVGKDNVEVAMKSMGALSKGAQAIAVEVADYTKKSFEDGTAALEKLFGVTADYTVGRQEKISA